MTGKEKKEVILKKIKEGDPRSYNQISADLELQIWTAKYKGWDWVQKKLSKP